MDNKDCPAYPSECEQELLGGLTQTYQFAGLSKREYMATAAMQGMIREDIERLDCKDDIAVHSVRFADALLKALQEGE